MFQRKLRKGADQKNYSRCGKGLHDKNKCPAKDAECHRCHKKGHYGAQCFISSKKIAEVRGDENAIMTAFLDTLEREDAKSWRVNVEVNKQKVCFKLDTGAKVTAINDQTDQKLKPKGKLSKVNKALYGLSRHPLKVLGQLNAYLSHKNKCCVVEQPIYVVKGLQSNLLGLPAIKALDLVARIDTTELLNNVLLYYVYCVWCILL